MTGAFPTVFPAVPIVGVQRLTRKGLLVAEAQATRREPGSNSSGLLYFSDDPAYGPHHVAHARLASCRAAGFCLAAQAAARVTQNCLDASHYSGHRISGIRRRLRQAPMPYQFTGSFTDRHLYLIWWF